MTATGFYEASDLAQATGLSRTLVTRYLRGLNPKHPRNAWHRLSEAQFRASVDELRAAKAKCPKQPLHAVARRRKEKAQ